MKVKQVVSTKFHSAYASWNSLELTEENGDEISIKMTDDDYLSLVDTLIVRQKRILEERAEKAAKLANKPQSEKENSEDE